MNKFNDYEKLKEKPIHFVCQQKGYGKTYYEIQKLIKENKQLQAKVKQLETNIDEAIEYIKHSWRLKFDQIYDVSKDLSGWEVEELQQKVNQLETNRDELKKWLENHWEQNQDIWFVKVLNKIAELERGKECSK